MGKYGPTASDKRRPLTEIIYGHTFFAYNPAERETTAHYKLTKPFCVFIELNDQRQNLHVHPPTPKSHSKCRLVE